MNAGALEDAGPPGTQRLDKWLWFARFVKTRTLASDLVSGGKVRLNKVRVEKPAQPVRPGDVLTISLHRRVQLVRVLAIAERRGPSAAAQALYEQLTVEGDAIKPQAPSLPAATRGTVDATPAERPVGSGRPTKKERRAIDRFNGKAR